MEHQSQQFSYPGLRYDLSETMVHKWEIIFIGMTGASVSEAITNGREPIRIQNPRYRSLGSPIQ